MNKEKLEKIVDETFERLMAHPNALNVAVGTKWIGGKDTGKSCVVIYVSEKKSKNALLTAGEKPVPKTVSIKINGVRTVSKTDVVELRSPDFEMGKTGISNQLPSIQRRMMGVIKNEE